MTINNLVLIGNLVEAPKIDVTNAGAVRARFRVASTERRFDAGTDSWQDGESVFIQVTCWRRLAQNVGNSLDKGDRVIVSGRLRQWVAENEGVRRTVHEIEADAVGPDLQRVVASISRTRRPFAQEGTSPEEVPAEAAPAEPSPFAFGPDDGPGLPDPHALPEQHDLGGATPATEPQLARAV